MKLPAVSADNIYLSFLISLARSLVHADTEFQIAIR